MCSDDASHGRGTLLSIVVSCRRRAPEMGKMLICHLGLQVNRIATSPARILHSVISDPLYGIEHNVCRQALSLKTVV